MLSLRHLYGFATLRTVRGAVAGAALLVLLGGNMGAGCSSASQVSSIDVPMEYRPRSADATPAVSIPGDTPPTVYVSPTVDNRADKRVIGRNTEDDTPLPVFAAGKPPADLVTEALRQELEDAGLTVADDVSTTQRQIDSEIQKFEVNEDKTYKSEVRLRVKVLDPTGKVLYQGTGVGTGQNWGRSKSAVNYQETYSDALRRAIGKIMADPGFTKALATAE